jgi:hypothetical protein
MAGAVQMYQFYLCSGHVEHLHYSEEHMSAYDVLACANGQSDQATHSTSAFASIAAYGLHISLTELLDL